MRLGFIFLCLLTVLCLGLPHSALSHQRDTLNGKPVYGMIAYVAKPDKYDSTCIIDIAKAKRDIAKGRLVVTNYMGLGSETLRYENQLAQLCRQKGLIYRVEGISCIVFEGQTEGCYGAYMDRHLMETYGSDFLKKLARTADSLFVANLDNSTKIFPSWNCDNPPHLTDDDGEEIEIAPMPIPAALLKSSDEEKPVKPYIDVHLIIEKDGSINTMYLGDYAIQPKSMRKYEGYLLSMAKEHIERAYSHWFPAEIAAVPMRSDHTVRLYLVVGG